MAKSPIDRLAEECALSLQHNTGSTARDLANKSAAQFRNFGVDIESAIIRVLKVLDRLEREGYVVRNGSARKQQAVPWVWIGEIEDSPKPDPKPAEIQTISPAMQACDVRGITVPAGPHFDEVINAAADRVIAAMTEKFERFESFFVEMPGASDLARIASVEQALIELSEKVSALGSIAAAPSDSDRYEFSLVTEIDGRRIELHRKGPFTPYELRRIGMIMLTIGGEG